METAIAIPSFKRIAFPGPAGELLRGENWGRLLVELRRDYPRYHAYLAERLEQIGHAPDPSDYADDIGGWIDAWGEIQEILTAEALLRDLRASRSVREAPLVAADAPALPLVDEHHRLVSAETGTATRGATSDRRVGPREPPPLPTPPG